MEEKIRVQEIENDNLLNKVRMLEEEKEEDQIRIEQLEEENAELKEKEKSNRSLIGEEGTRENKKDDNKNRKYSQNE